jgi:hypothetical protein
MARLTMDKTDKIKNLLNLQSYLYTITIQKSVKYQKLALIRYNKQDDYSI